MGFGTGLATQPCLNAPTSSCVRFLRALVSRLHALQNGGGRPTARASDTAAGHLTEAPRIARPRPQAGQLMSVGAETSTCSSQPSAGRPPPGVRPLVLRFSQPSSSPAQ